MMNPPSLLKAYIVKYTSLKKISSCAVALAAMVMGTASATSDIAYPEKPIRIVVPYAAGGSTDVLSRLLGEKLSNDLGQPVIVENRSGAASNIGVSYVANSDPDGYTLGLVTSTALSVNPWIYKTLSFDPKTSFEPIVLATVLPSFVLVNSSSDINSVKELNAYLKDPKEAISYASSGAGSAPHLGAELYRSGVGFDAVHVPYRGGVPALTGLVGGETNFMIAVTPEAQPLMEGGKLKALAVTTLERLPSYPDIPTVAESGIPDYELIWGFGFVAPKGTPSAIIDRLNVSFNKALKDPQVITRLNGLGYEIVGGTPADLSNLMDNDREKWGKIAKEINLTVD